MFPSGFENSMFTGKYLSSTDLIEGDPGDNVGSDVRFGDGPGVVDVI